MNIIYDDILRRFKLEGTDKVFKGVTSVLSMIQNDFNAEEAAMKFVTSKNNTEGWDYETILEKWSEKSRISVERGNGFHLMKENEVIGNGGFSFKSENGYKVFNLDRLKNLQSGEYVELILPHIPTWTIGIADKVTIDDKDFFIRDYKCIEDLKFESKEYYDAKKKKRIRPKLKPPVSHLDDCKGMKIMLQLSLYAYYLESFGYRFRGGVIEQAIFKNEKYDHSIEHPMTYFKKEAELILKYFKLKNN